MPARPKGQQGSHWDGDKGSCSSSSIVPPIDSLYSAETIAPWFL